MVGPECPVQTLIIGRMMFLPPVRLRELLSIMLALLAVQHIGAASTPVVSVVAEPIIAALEEDHDVEPSLASEVMGLFGDREGTQWTADVRGMVRGIGIGRLEAMNGPQAMAKFLLEWRNEVGETWEELVHIDLLEVRTSCTHLHAIVANVQGDCLIDSASPGAPAKMIPFPSHALPLHAATRFADLFLTRPRWRPDDMAPFLRGLTRDGDAKELDKLVVKHVRVVKEKEGTWWYPRRTT